MKKITFLLSLLLFSVFVYSQGGTNFLELSLDKALEKAGAENKMVFVDCYTAWCGPCKMMATKILPLESVGTFMNEHFVCVKFDMEKGEGMKIARKYRVSSYPTFLIIKTDGELLHRVIGGTATGEEFIKKIEEGIDENSVGNLEKQYIAGNRNLDFLIQYIQALVKSCDVEKARGIAQEVLASLDDDEKCTGQYWFIYESNDLSPVGSGNMNYLLKRVDQFRAGVGKEDVDKKVASLFETQLEDIIRGKNRVATLADVDAAEKLLASYKLDDQKYLADYIVLIKAFKGGNTDEILNICKDVYPRMADNKLAYLYFAPIASLKSQWSAKQKAELATLTKQVADKVQVKAVKLSLESFANEISTRW